MKPRAAKNARRPAAGLSLEKVISMDHARGASGVGEQRQTTRLRRVVSVSCRRIINIRTHLITILLLGKQQQQVLLKLVHLYFSTSSVLDHHGRRRKQGHNYQIGKKNKQALVCL
jgi:hypothetical protein